MSNKFVKILTVCALILVVPFIVVATAITLNQAVTVKVGVDAIFNSAVADYVENAGVKISINGEVFSANGENASFSKNVKKGNNVTIAIETNEYEFTGLMEGDKNGNAVNPDEGKTNIYTIKADKDLNFAAIFDASKYFDVSFKYTIDGINIQDKDRIELNVDGENIYKTETGYAVKAGENITLSYRVVGYNLNSWSENGQTIEVSNWTSRTVKVDSALDVVADFSIIKYTVRYDGAETTEIVEFNKSLKDIGALKNYKEGEGWKKLISWEYNGKTYQYATFGKVTEEINLTPVYKSQASSYTIKTSRPGLNNCILTYNIADGRFVENAENKYYNFSNITVGGHKYNILDGVIDSTERKQFEAYLMTNTISNVKSEWTLKYNIKLKSTYGINTEEITLDKNTNVYSTTLLKLLKLENNKEISKIEVSFPTSENKIIVTGTECFYLTVAEILDKVELQSGSENIFDIVIL